MIAYHIDRLNALNQGDIIELENYSVNPLFLKEIIDSRYPDGLSHHGEKYYTRQANQDTLQDILTENIYEYERKLYFPELPSRLQSFFASETIQDSKIWASKFGLRNYTILEIDIQNNQYAKLDASWLGVNKNSLSFLVSAYHAKKYWSGEPSDNPQWELLVRPPIKIIATKKVC